MFAEVGSSGYICLKSLFFWVKEIKKVEGNNLTIDHTQEVPLR